MITLPPGLVFFERGWLSSNNVLLSDASQSVLIDTGYHTHALQTLALVKSVLGDQPLTRIINTHLHSDHCGGNALLREVFPSMDIHIPPGHAALVDVWDETGLTYEATGQSCPRFEKTGILNIGAVFEVGELAWHVHAAAGHDPHSVILFNESHRILISADALWENGFGVVFPEIEGINAFDEVESTLRMIEALEPKLVLPGHGAAFRDVSGALSRANSRLTQFRSSPNKHAHYAAKVLLKFKLLELQKHKLTQFLNWAQSTPYLQLLHVKYAHEQSLESWCLDLCRSLEVTGACALVADEIINM